MNPKMEQRRNQLARIAKKQEHLGTGKYNRKDVEKLLEKAKRVYTDVRQRIEGAEAEAERLEASMSEMKKEMMAAREDILHSHDILQTMDFSNATAVRLRKDKDDVSYAIDGKWKRVNKDYSTLPYSEWKKQQASAADDNDDDDDDNDGASDEDIEGHEFSTSELE
jgi:hypothetical protein